MVKISCCTIFFMIFYEMLKNPSLLIKLLANITASMTLSVTGKKRVQYQVSKLIYTLD